MEEQRQRAKPHKIMLDKRAHAMISGVREVISFDEKEVVLETELGRLSGEPTYTSEQVRDAVQQHLLNRRREKHG